MDLLFTVLSVLYGFPGDSDGKKNLPAMQETQDQSLGQEDSLEKKMAIHSSPLSWKIPWMGERGSHCPWSNKELDMTERLN